MSMRSTLIRSFTESLTTANASEMVTLLALIGIETVLQESNGQVCSQVNAIKEQIQSNLLPQSTKRERTLTPKITETRAPAPALTTRRQYPQRHHLDDQAMRQALTHEDEPETTKRNATPKQSIKYFIDLQQPKQNIKQRNVLNGTTVSKSYKEQLKQIHQGMQNEILQDYKKIIQNKDLQVSSTPEQSMEQIKQYTQDQRTPKQTLQNSQNLDAEYHSQQMRKSQQSTCQFEQIQSQQDSLQLQMQKQLLELPKRNVQHLKKISTETNQSETFSFLQQQRRQATEQDSLAHMADRLLQSPIIRQVSLRSPPESAKPSQEIHVSNFDEEDDESSNSSAFSLFQPNEELKMFFRHGVDNENQDPNIKYSNIFLKGRMGGSKVF